MRKSTLAAGAIAAGLAVAAPAANAMPAMALGRLGLPEGARNPLQKTVLVCDPWTCYWRPGDWGYGAPSPYRAWRRHYWWGWHRPWWGWDSTWRRW